MDLNNFLKNFGLQVKIARMKKGITQAKLAEILSLQDDSNIGMIERGQKNVTLKTVLRLAQALEVEPLKFFDFK